MVINNKYVEVSGLPSFEEQKILLPSGQFQIPVEAFLSSINATFGFNSNPHRFDLTYVPTNFADDVLPPIGSGVSLNIGNFYISGRVKHADYSKALNGNILNISIEDIREDLEDTIIDTNGLYGTSDAPANNIVDIRFWYEKTFVETRVFARSRIIKDLKLLKQHGASYRQLYDAISFFETTIGNINGIISKLPIPEVIETQLPGNPDAYRWIFSTQPLIEVINKIMDDISYDWYWNMAKQNISVVNRKFSVDIAKENIPIAGDINETINLKYGIDEGERPTNIRILGDQMEGLVGSGRLMTQSGAQELTAAEYDLGIQVGSPTYVKGWKATLKYFGADGHLTSYVPNDRELSMALKGMEYWAMEKGLDNRIANFTIDPATGKTVEQKSITGSGMGLIPNRRQEDRSWIVEWYNRVRTFAQNHFGRTYVLDIDSILYKHIDNIEVESAAWCNLENLTDEGSFVDGYKISNKFRFLAPFWRQEVNKMRGWVLLPPNTKWGLDGEGVPAQFDEWNEDPINGDQFVPIEVSKWDSTNKKFSEDFLEALDIQEKGIMVRLPNLAWANQALSTVSNEDEDLKKVQRLGALKSVFGEEIASIDIPNPHRIIVPFQKLDNVSIPISVKRRYGHQFPSVWASGTGTAFEFDIRQDFAPWNFEPRGIETSTGILDSEATVAMSARVVARNTVTFAEANKIGLPVISFDSFANQDQVSKGYGVVAHGITSLSLTRPELGAWQTRYNIKTHFPDFLKIKPIKKAVGEDFNFAIKRLIGALPIEVPAFEVDPFFDPEVDDGRKSIKTDTGIEHTLKKNVVIQRVFDRGENEFYLSRDEQGIRWPRALAIPSFGGRDSLKQAHAIDGFLQIGMPAVYNLEKLPDGRTIHFYTGGITLTAGRVLELSTSPRLVKDIWIANAKTLPTQVQDSDGQSFNITPFDILDVPFVDQRNVDQSLSPGDKLLISSHGNKKDLVPGVSYGPLSDRFNDAFLVNGGGAAETIFPAFVTVTPNTSTGKTGAIKRVTDGQIFSDGITISGSKYNLFFIGAEFDQIEINDHGVVFQVRETDGTADFRLYMLILKPEFMGISAFGG